MVAWLVTYWNIIGDHLTSGSEAGRAGAAIGATVATGMIFFSGQPVQSSLDYSRF